MFGKLNSAETRDKMSISQGSAIFVYTPDRSSIVYTFPSAKKLIFQ